MGGAISQVIVSIISSSFILIYALRTSTFILGRKESVVLSIMPLIALYEVLVDPVYLDFLLLVFVLLIFKLFKIITIEDVKLIESFSPLKLKFVALLMKMIS
jgi:O-antigen/teichoic acid export membrane protein